VEGWIKLSQDESYKAVESRLSKIIHDMEASWLPLACASGGGTEKGGEPRPTSSPSAMTESRERKHLIARIGPGSSLAFCDCLILRPVPCVPLAGDHEGGGSCPGAEKATKPSRQTRRHFRAFPSPVTWHVEEVWKPRLFLEPCKGGAPDSVSSLRMWSGGRPLLSG
jgi:hypothetical protein